MLYPINPNRSVPWNNLPLLPIRKELYQTIEILEKLGDFLLTHKITTLKNQKSEIYQHTKQNIVIIQVFAL